MVQRSAANDQETIKIILMGLDNSGKSSILLSMAKSNNLMSYFSLKPTPGINVVSIEDQDKCYSIWEFGGQEKYRMNYLTNLKKYAQEVDTLIFVIDVQDVKRYNAALSYLGTILKLLNDLNNITLHIYFHKFDPGLEALDEFSEAQISSRLIKKIENIVPPDINFNIYRTSIYTVFQKDLYH